MNVFRGILRLGLQGNGAEDVHQIEVRIRAEELGFTQQAGFQGGIQLHAGNIGNHVVGAVDGLVGILPEHGHRTVVGGGIELVHLVDLGLIAIVAAFHGVVGGHVAEHPQVIVVQGVVDSVYRHLRLAGRCIIVLG